MKLLVFAHKPPPHHGQSYMVQLFLDALGGDTRQAHGAGSDGSPIQCYHVDARLSSGLQDVGRARWGKVFLALKYCGEAVWCRFRYGVTNFYYVPAFPNRTPIYRDWIVLGLCRPFFKRRIFHFHAVGLGQWLATQARPWERWISRWVYDRPDLSLVLLANNRDDATQLASRHVEVVPNGIPDPCPHFETEVRPRRLARATARHNLFAGASGVVPQAGTDPHVFRVLFLSLCFRPKGLFDTLEAVALANRQLQATALRIELDVAGSFWLEAEKREFEERVRQPDLMAAGVPVVNYLGFVTGGEKSRLLRESDCLCFPTYYAAESFGLVVVEAMAHGLPVITTRWRGIPEILPAKYPGLVEPRAPDQIADHLIELARCGGPPGLREHFLAHYTDIKFGERIKSVLLGL